MTNDIDFLRVVFQIIILVMSAVAHEVSHGFIAYQLGDPTAKDQGRLTLNPLKHLDLYGSVILPILMYIGTFGQFFFAAAKPVPYNPYYFRNPTKDAAKVALAGPVTNFLIAIVFGLILRFAFSGLPATDFFNRFGALLSDIVLINIMLGVFNLVPIPPLDGSRVIRVFFPRSYFLDRVEPYGLFILIIMMIFGVFSLLIPIIYFVYKLIIGI